MIVYVYLTYLLFTYTQAKRYPPNPEAFWGPKARARGKKRKVEGADEEADVAENKEAKVGDGVEIAAADSKA